MKLTLTPEQRDRLARLWRKRCNGGNDSSDSTWEIAKEGWIKDADSFLDVFNEVLSEGAHHVQFGAPDTTHDMATLVRIEHKLDAVLQAQRQTCADWTAVYPKAPQPGPQYGNAGPIRSIMGGANG